MLLVDSIFLIGSDILFLVFCLVFVVFYLLSSLCFIGSLHGSCLMFLLFFLGFESKRFFISFEYGSLAFLCLFFIFITICFVSFFKDSCVCFLLSFCFLDFSFLLYLNSFLFLIFGGGELFFNFIFSSVSLSN